jgi:hypothetical protein
VDNIRVLPGLNLLVLQYRSGRSLYLRESTIVPEVTLVGEAVANKSKLALLDVLLDRVATDVVSPLYFRFSD